LQNVAGVSEDFESFEWFLRFNKAVQGFVSENVVKEDIRVWDGSGDKRRH
jgi:hypothetical protein